MKTINSYKVLSLVDSYQEYPIPRIFGDDHYYTFIHGSLYGLFCLSDKNTVNLLGINNSKKHNGHYTDKLKRLTKTTTQLTSLEVFCW